MQECMSKYPALYNRDNGEDDESDPMNFEDLEDAGNNSNEIRKENVDTVEKSSSKN